MKDKLLIKNGRLITMDERQRADWMLISRGRIEAVGSGEDYKAHIDDAEHVEVIDAEGKTVLPGFIDSHFHVVKTAVIGRCVDLSEVKNFRELGEKMKSAAAERKKSGGAVLGCGLNYETLEEGRFPDRTVLDEYCKNIPAVIYSKDYHALMLNTYGILHYKVPFTYNGMELDEKGIPTGVFRKQAGAKLDETIIASFPDEEIVHAIGDMLPHLFSLGLTTVAAMEGGNIKLHFGDDREGDLIYKYGDRYPMDMKLFYQTTDVEHVVNMGLSRIGGALYLDGTMGERTAALTFDYADDPGRRGLLCFDQEYLRDFVCHCCENNLQIALDAIGDAAIDAALDAFACAAERFDIKAMRHRIEHAELVTEPQMERAAALGVLLSMQPTYEQIWGSPGGMYEQRLGERYGQTNQFRQVMDAGVMVCGGSDSSVTDPNPMVGIHYAVNHPVPEHRVSLEEALKMYTYNGAYGLFMENRIGSLTSGKAADVVILDRDIEAADPEIIKEIKAEITIKDGNILYSRGNYVKA